MRKQVLQFVVPVLSSALILGSVVVGSAAGWLSVPAVQAQEQQPVAQAATSFPGTITVVGEGKVTLEPDIARVSIGVETLRNTVKEASDENRATVEAVLAALTSSRLVSSILLRISLMMLSPAAVRLRQAVRVSQVLPRCQ